MPLAKASNFFLDIRPYFEARFLYTWDPNRKAKKGEKTQRLVGGEARRRKNDR